MHIQNHLSRLPLEWLKCENPSRAFSSGKDKGKVSLSTVNTTVIAGTSTSIRHSLSAVDRLVHKFNQRAFQSLINTNFDSWPIPTSCRYGNEHWFTCFVRFNKEHP
ncbi:hypothetical protein CW304_00765 [Bacillus sp. UFRGS-B20]|nr:hypothetical protein CW304_00765 [Bacillus sp. UFRGS-B20]